MVKAFTVDRDKWNRGEGVGAGVLWNKHDCGCVLGHYAIACGIQKEKILGRMAFCRSELTGVGGDFEWNKLDPVFYTDSMSSPSRESVAITELNDTTDFGDCEREENLIRAFAEYGIALSFTGQG